MFSILFIYPFSKHLSSTFSVLAVMAHAGGSGRPTRLKPQDRILALKELLMQRRKPVHSHTQAVERWAGRVVASEGHGEDCLSHYGLWVMHVRRITVDTSGCPSWCLACSFSVVGAQVYPYGGMPGSVLSTFYVYLMNSWTTLGDFIISSYQGENQLSMIYNNSSDVTQVVSGGAEVVLRGFIFSVPSPSAVLYILISHSCLTEMGNWVRKMFIRKGIEDHFPFITDIIFSVLVLTHSENGISETFCTVRHPGSTHGYLSITGGVKQMMENQAFLFFYVFFFFFVFLKNLVASCTLSLSIC